LDCGGRAFSLETRGGPLLSETTSPAIAQRSALPEMRAVPETTVLPDQPVLFIRPTSGWRALNLLELWQARELLWFLALRDIQVRYKQTVLGAAWAVIQPVLMMVVFSLFFGRLGGLDQRIGAIPYSLFAFCGLVPWQLFSYAMTQSSNSVVNEQRLLTKVYFPRVIIPLAPTLSALVDFAIAFVVLLGLMAWNGVYPGGAILWLPLFVALAVLAALAVGLWLSALNALYRDVRYTIPFLTQFWLFATPIAYPSSIVPEEWQCLYALNPMVGVVDGFRWTLLGMAPPSWGPLAVSVLATGALLIGGLLYFRRMEKTFADMV
jgi:lipopolysaccharide transport system permease protein